MSLESFWPSSLVYLLYNMLNDKIQAQLRLLLAWSGRKSRHRVHRQTAIAQCPYFGNVIVERGCLNVRLYLICQSCINLRLLSGNDEASKAVPQESDSLSVAVTGKIAFRQDRDVPASGNPNPECTKPRTLVTNMSENYFQSQS
jgi:hypothetical protein